MGLTNNNRLIYNYAGSSCGPSFIIDKNNNDRCVFADWLPEYTEYNTTAGSCFRYQCRNFASKSYGLLGVWKAPDYKIINPSEIPREFSITNIESGNTFSITSREKDALWFEIDSIGTNLRSIYLLHNYYSSLQSMYLDINKNNSTISIYAPPSYNLPISFRENGYGQDRAYFNTKAYPDNVYSSSQINTFFSNTDKIIRIFLTVVRKCWDEGQHLDSDAQGNNSEASLQLNIVQETSSSLGNTYSIYCFGLEDKYKCLLYSLNNQYTMDNHGSCGYIDFNGNFS